MVTEEVLKKVIVAWYEDKRTEPEINLTPLERLQLVRYVKQLQEAAIEKFGEVRFKAPCNGFEISMNLNFVFRNTLDILESNRIHKDSQLALYKIWELVYNETGI